MDVLRTLLIVLIASQFILIQLITHAQFGDAPRNMHWGIYITERPEFLIGAPDDYDRVHGFRPDPETLAPEREYVGSPGRFHPWWGPLIPLIFATVWIMTKSYAALELLMPLVSFLVFVVTYIFVSKHFDYKVGLLSIAVLSLIPAYRYFGSMAFVESLTSLFLLLAFWSFYEKKTKGTIIFSSMAILCKLDAILLYFSVVIVYSFIAERNDFNLKNRHLMLSGLMPFIFASVILVRNYMIYGALFGVGVSENCLVLLQKVFLGLVVSVAQLFFGWDYGASYLGFFAGVSFAIIVYFLWENFRNANRMVHLLSIWIVLDIIIYAGYLFFTHNLPYARILTPSFVPLSILVANGFFRMKSDHGSVFKRFCKPLLVSLILCLLILNLNVMENLRADGRALREYREVTDFLSEERGMVMSQMYWETILYARRPSTWFEDDPVFQRNILSEGNFLGYAKKNDIRYIVIPRDYIGFSAGFIDYVTDSDLFEKRLETNKWLVYEIN